MARAHRTVHHELSFRAVASANILIRENVTVLDQLGIAAIDALGTRLANSIRRSVHQNRQGLSLILRRKDQRVQAHAVTRRNHLFAFLERLGNLDRGLVADSFRLVILAILAPNQACHFSFSVADKDRDRKSTRLNSSHEWSSYAVFCLKK